MSKPLYTVTVTQEGDWNILTIRGPGLNGPGVTQAEDMEDFIRMAQDYLCCYFDTDDHEEYEIKLVAGA